MKEFRKSVAQLENRYQEEWFGWLSKLLDSTLINDNSTQPQVTAACQHLSSNSQQHLWQRFADFIKAVSQRPPDKTLSPQMERFLKEFNIDRAVLSSLPKKEERENYIITCIRKLHDSPLKASNLRRKSMQYSQQTVPHPPKNSASMRKKDAFDWFDVRSKYPYLKPKVKRVLVKSAYESDDVTPCNEKTMTPDVRQPDFEDGWDEQKEELMRSKIKQLKEMFRQRNPLKPGKSKSVTDNQYNTIAFDDIGHQLKQTKSPDRGDLLRKFLQNQDGLTTNQMKYLLDTSPLMNKAVDRNFVKGAIRKVDSNQIDQIQLQIADEIIRKFSSSRDYIKDVRNQWKRRKIGQTVRKIKRFERVQQNRQANQSVKRQLRKLRSNVEKQLKFSNVPDPTFRKVFALEEKGWPVPLNHHHPPSALFCASNQNILKVNNYEKTYLNDLKNNEGRNSELQRNMTQVDLRMFYTGGNNSCYHINGKLHQQNNRLLKNELSSYYTSMLLHERMTARQAACQQHMQQSYLDKENVGSPANSSRNTHRGSQRQLSAQPGADVPNRRLFLAVLQNNIQLFRGMVKEITIKELQATDRQNNTLLFYAARNRNMEMVETLLKLGAQVQKKCSRGQTALHVACRLNNLELINLLLRSADSGVMDILCDEGKTPLMRITDRTLLARIQLPSQRSMRN